MQYVTPPAGPPCALLCGLTWATELMVLQTPWMAANFGHMDLPRRERHLQAVERWLGIRNFVRDGEMHPLFCVLMRMLASAPMFRPTAREVVEALR